MELFLAGCAKWDHELRRKIDHLQEAPAWKHILTEMTTRRYRRFSSV
jgi:hypothetical protein